MKDLIASQVSDGDPEQIVEGASNVVHFEYFRELHDGFLETLNFSAHVALQLHSSKYCE